MAPFVAALDPSTKHPAQTWLEALVKAYVGDGLAADFYREIACSCPTRTRRWCRRCLPTPGTRLRRPGGPGGLPPTARSPGRLALWGRRLLGEAVTQAQAVIAEHDELAELIIAGTGRHRRRRAG